jgi:ribA/ribD-fused uncharacterized protein
VPPPKASDLADNRPVAQFRDAWFFLLNFFPEPVTFEGVTYPSVEHAYQAARCAREEDREAVRRAPSAGEAKRLGRRAIQVATWTEIRDSVMLNLLRQKFSRPGLRQLLLDTGTRPLVEENTWGDTYWGTVNGSGENRLGRLLEMIRLGGSAPVDRPRRRGRRMKRPGFCRDSI